MKMSQFSPKNVALGSLVLGGAGFLILIVGSIIVSDGLSLLGEAALILGFLGLYVAYLLNVLRFWESGAELAAVAFWALPNMAVLLIQYSLEGDNISRIMGACIGALFVSVVMILFLVWLKKQVKRHILKIDPILKPETPRYSVMIIVMLILTLLAVVGTMEEISDEHTIPAYIVPDTPKPPPSAPPTFVPATLTTPSDVWSGYTYARADSPRDTYDNYGISFSYPKGLWVYEDGLETGRNTYDEGVVTVQDSGAHESITVTWWYWGPETPDIPDILSFWINEVSKDPTGSNLVVGVEHKRTLDNGHTATYIPIEYDTVFEEISPAEVHLTGYLGGWYCDRTDRIILFDLETRGGSDVADRMLAAFSARCHYL